jgi:hypothetical protein
MANLWFPSEETAETWAAKSQYELHFKSAKGSDPERAEAKTELDRRRYDDSILFSNNLAQIAGDLTAAIKGSVDKLIKHQNDRHGEMSRLADRQYRAAVIAAWASGVVAAATVLLMVFAGLQVWLALQTPPPAPIHITVPPQKPATVEAIVKTPPINLTIEAPKPAEMGQEKAPQ